MNENFDIIRQEKEFIKENEKLQLQTKELMEKVDCVMKIQDNLIKQTFDIKQNQSTIITDNTNNRNNSQETNTNPKSVTDFLRTKIKNLHCDQQKLQNDYKKKCEELVSAQKENKNILEEKEKWFMQYNNTKIFNNKLEIQIQKLKSKIELNENENNSLKKENERLKCDLKTSNNDLNTSEIRLNRHKEEIEKYKTIIKTSKQEEKDIKDLHRKQINEITLAMKQIDKQKNDLLQAFKKQMQLIDNLKKQKTNLIAIKLSEISQNEFMKLLENQINDFETDSIT